MKNQIKIHPAILVDNLQDFIKQIKAAREYVNHIDVDIIDWSRTEGKTVAVKDILSIKSGIKMTFDLMMDYPSEAVETLIKEKNVENIIINYSQKEDFNALLENIKGENKNAGIALNPENEPQDIKEWIKKLDLIQIFTIEPGAQGMPFMPEMLAKAYKLRDMGYKKYIGIDGGVSKETIPQIIKYPIDILSVGSALSRAANPKKRYKHLMNLIKSK